MARAAHRAVLAVFAAAGLTFATWASRIPSIKSVLELSAGDLGLVLLAGSLGSVLTLPASGWVAARLGAKGATRLGIVVAALGVVGLGAGTDLVGARVAAAGALFVAAVGIALWDVTMNLEGADVERALGRSTMPTYHAAFSGGTVVGALLGAGAVRAGLGVLPHVALVALPVAALALGATSRYLPAAPPSSDGEVDARPRSAWTEPRTLLVGLFVLVAAFTEGTANDWIAVAFIEGHGVEEWVGTLAFAVFLGSMTTGRLLGTRWLDRWGRQRVLVPMLALAGAGSLLVVLGTPGLAFAGALLWGLGVSLGFPVGMSAAADDPARAASRLAVVATIGYTAFIAGPPLLGTLGDQVGVLRALLPVAALLLVALATVGSLGEPPARDPDPSPAPPRKAPR